MSNQNKNILKHLISGIILTFILVVPLLVQSQGGGGVRGEGGSSVPSRPAETPNPTINIEIKNPFKQDTIKGLIETIVNDILIQVGGVIAVMMIMWAGFLYVTAKGDPGQIKKAHDALLSAVIGAAILLGAWVISQAIGATIEQLKKP